MGSSVSRPTSRTSFSVISAKASAALRCRSTLSLNESVDSERSGLPAKKFVSARSVVGRRGGARESGRKEWGQRKSGTGERRCEFARQGYVPLAASRQAGEGGPNSLSRYCSRSATASRSLSSRSGSYVALRERPPSDQNAEGQVDRLVVRSRAFDGERGRGAEGVRAIGERVVVVVVSSLVRSAA